MLESGRGNSDMTTDQPVMDDLDEASVEREEDVVSGWRSGTGARGGDQYVAPAQGVATGRRIIFPLDDVAAVDDLSTQKEGGICMISDTPSPIDHTHVAQEPDPGHIVLIGSSFRRDHRDSFGERRPIRAFQQLSIKTPSVTVLGPLPYSAAHLDPASRPPERMIRDIQRMSRTRAAEHRQYARAHNLLRSYAEFRIQRVLLFRSHRAIPR